jgi:Plasmid stabilisation system protein.
MNVSFLAAAEAELAEAVQYYNQQRTGLGGEFLVELLTVIEHIRRYPQAWPPMAQDLRRCRMRRFPYGVLYQPRDSEIIVVAIGHMHRKPMYWRDRLSS